MPTPLPNNNRPSDKKPNTFKFNLWWMYLIVLVFLAGLFYFDQQTVSKEVSYTTFEQYVERDHGIADIVVFTDKKRVEGRLTDSLANVLFPTSTSIIKARALLSKPIFPRPISCRNG